MIPRRLFMYWADGFEAAPRIVQLCVESWKRQNPDFDVVLLDDTNLREWLDPEVYLRADSLAKLTIQKYSNLVRAGLLSEHGGLWADATLFCARPVDDWLDLNRTAFLALSTNKGSNRFLRNYFLASRPNHFFVSQWLEQYARFLSFDFRPMRKVAQKRLRRLVPVVFSSKIGTLVWTLKPIARRYGYPYLIMHYILNRMILSRPRFAWTYFRMKRLKPLEGLRFQEQRASAELIERMDQRKEPVWKLTWRTYVAPEFWGPVIDHLEKKRASLI